MPLKVPSALCCMNETVKYRRGGAFLEREPILQVVWLYQITAGEKGLMANQHSLLEAFPGKRCGCRQAAHV